MEKEKAVSEKKEKKKAGPRKLKGLYNISMVAEKIGVSEITIRREIERGHLFATRFGNFYRIPPQAIDYYINKEAKPISDEELLEWFHFESKNEYTLNELLEVLPLDRHTVQNMLKQGRLVSVKRGRAHYFPKQVLVAFLRGEETFIENKPAEPEFISDSQYLLERKFADKSEYLVKEIAASMDVKPVTVQRWITDKKLIGYKRGREWWIPRYNVLNFLRGMPQRPLFADQLHVPSNLIELYEKTCWEKRIDPVTNLENIIHELRQ